MAGDYRTALGDSGQVAEGVPTTQAVVRLARRLAVEMPICEQVDAILFRRTPGVRSGTRPHVPRAEMRGELDGIGAWLMAGDVIHRLQSSKCVFYSQQKRAHFTTDSVYELPHAN